MPQLLRTDAALEQISRFRDSDDFDPFADAFIEAMCVRSAAIMCIAEIEEIVGREVEARLAGALDSKAASFIAANLASILRRTSKSDIAKTVGMFGEDSKNLFNAALTDQEVSAYDNLLTGRHEAAHAEGGNLSFTELTAGVAAAQKMIDNFQACIA